MTKSKARKVIAQMNRSEREKMRIHRAAQRRYEINVDRPRAYARYCRIFFPETEKVAQQYRYNEG